MRQGTSMFEGIHLGQFVPVNSFLHRLDPRTKILCAIITLMAVMLIDSWAGYFILTLIIVIAIFFSGVSIYIVFRSLAPFWIILLLTFLLQLLFTPGEILWGRSPIGITKEGLQLGCQILWKLFLLVMTGSLLTITTSPLDLTAGLASLLTPLKRFGVPVHELAMMMTIAMRFIPVLLHEAQVIIKAQRSRGLELDQVGVFQRTKALVPLLVPLFLSTFRRAEELATAMEARCYRSGINRSRMRPLTLKQADFYVLGLCFLILAGIVFLHA